MPDGMVTKKALHAHRRIQLGRSRSAFLDGMVPLCLEISMQVNTYVILTGSIR